MSVRLIRKHKPPGIHFSCFSTNLSDNRCTGASTTRRPPKREWFKQVLMADHCSLLSPPNFLGSLFLLVAWGSTCSPFRCVQVVQVVQLLQRDTASQEALLCLMFPCWCCSWLYNMDYICPGLTLQMINHICHSFGTWKNNLLVSTKVRESRHLGLNCVCSYSYGVAVWYVVWWCLCCKTMTSQQWAWSLAVLNLGH